MAAVEADEAAELSLMSPYRLGKQWGLSHRVVMAPLTRCRAVGRLPNEAHVLYYSQRANPGGLIFSEATCISASAHGYPNTPGIYTDPQVEAWKPVTAAVHAKGGLIFCQLWHVGRASNNVFQPGGGSPISSTSKRISDRWKILLPDQTHGPYSQPTALTTAEIGGVVQDYRQAALNSVRAGFDAVEINAAYGYLIDQFLKDEANDRCDHYGGSLPNRIRLLVEVVQALAEAIGMDRVGVKISPTLHHQDSSDSDPLALGLAVADALNAVQDEAGPGTRLTHLQFQMGSGKGEQDAEVMRAVRRAYRGTFMVCGGYDRESGDKAVAEGDADLIGFGRHFLSNPDLVERFKAKDAPLNPYDPATFYTYDPVVGYTDYPFLGSN
ncbi:hypothetical protein V2J09_016320 [Rumex salicifolius]